MDDLFERSAALKAQAAAVFTPRTPITTKDLFAGRWNELTDISDAVRQPGLHVVIYGERGVGKTSLANVIKPTIFVLDTYGKQDDETERLVLKVVANSGDAFTSIWHRLFNEIQWAKSDDSGGTAGTKETFNLPDWLTIDDVRRVLASIEGGVFIVDEFDQAKREVSKEFTELLKALSDYNVNCTVVLVGVSETVENLILDHASVRRAITQIGLKRMTPDELKLILTNAEKALQISFAEDARQLIVHVSQGLPHYTHLIGLNAIRSAAERLSLATVERDDVFDALKKAVKQAEQTITQKHSTAIHSSQKNALYREVLLACAIAASLSSDPLGYFTPSAIIAPLGEILKRSVINATFANHLREFHEEKRGCVLERDGQPWGFRYRFRDPLLVPFVFMDGLEAGIASGHSLVQMLKGEPN